jgi:hypothetical protein
MKTSAKKLLLPAPAPHLDRGSVADASSPHLGLRRAFFHGQQGVPRHALKGKAGFESDREQGVFFLPRCDQKIHFEDLGVFFISFYSAFS